MLRSRSLLFLADRWLLLLRMLQGGLSATKARRWMDKSGKAAAPFVQHCKSALSA